MIDRRALLGMAVTAGAAVVLDPAPARSDETDQPPQFRIVDTNISLFHWPFRRLPLDELDRLVKKLRSLGISQAWAGSFEALLHRDLAGVNQRLAAACARYPELVPVGSVNLELHGWRDDLRRCIEEHNMPCIRLYPNYHGYALDDSRFGRLLERAAAARRLVQIAVAMEDTRTQHARLQTPDVDLAPLADRMQDIHEARVQILNYRPRSPLLERLAENPRIFFDTARVEGTDGIPELMRRVSHTRVMFGTHAPFLIPEAALIRVHESGKLGEEQLRQLLSQNADRALTDANR